VVLRVVLAEDNYLVREGLRSALAAYVDLELVAACADLGSLLDAVTEYEPDVVLTDIRMPPDSTDEGIRAANHLRGTYPHVGVVVLSQYDDAAYALALLKDGSAGRAYLLKERIADPDEIATAIREVARRGSVIDPKIVDVLVAAKSTAEPSPLAALTPREREVLAAVAQGKSNAAIAGALSLTGGAVEKHINAIFSKLGLSEVHDIDRRVKAALVFLADAT
jgi:DNA-binding NarL/FixJ family response regulator